MLHISPCIIHPPAWRAERRPSADTAIFPLTGGLATDRPNIHHRSSPIVNRDRSRSLPVHLSPAFFVATGALRAIKHPEIPLIPHGEQRNDGNINGKSWFSRGPFPKTNRGPFRSFQSSQTSHCFMELDKTRSSLSLSLSFASLYLGNSKEASFLDEGSFASEILKIAADEGLRRLWRSLVGSETNGDFRVPRDSPRSMDHLLSLRRVFTTL